MVSHQLAVAAVLADYQLETNNSEIRGFNDTVTFYRLTPEALNLECENYT